MKTPITVALLLSLSCNLWAAELLFEENAPPGELRLLKTLSGVVDVAVYQSGQTENPNLFKQGDTYLRIQDGTNTWWVSPPISVGEIDVSGFGEEALLLVVLRSASASSTRVLNINTRESYSLGQGSGEIITDGPDQGLILLNGQYGYDDEGRYWYSSIVDWQGRVFAFSADGDSCLPINQIVGPGADTSQLRQPLDSCVWVFR